MNKKIEYFSTVLLFVYSFPKMTTQRKRHLSALSSIPWPKRIRRDMSKSDKVKLIKDSETLPRSTLKI
jgi:hypothetical protein